MVDDITWPPSGWEKTTGLNRPPWTLSSKPSTNLLLARCPRFPWCFRLALLRLSLRSGGDETLWNAHYRGNNLRVVCL